MTTQELVPAYNLCEDCGGDGAVNLWGSKPDLSDEFLLGANPTEVENEIQNFLNGGFESYIENDPSVKAWEYEGEREYGAVNLS